MKTVPLYAGAEKKSYYKYLRPIAHVPDKEIRRVKSIKTDPSLAIAFSDRAIVQTPDYVPIPDGVYQMSDDSFFISCVIPTPDLTGDMMEWWMPWHMLDPLRYALWNPEDHYDTHISEKARKRILSDKIPMRKKCWGVRCKVTESWNGEKPSTGVLNFVDPASVGFDDSLIGTDSCQFMLVANNAQQLGPITLLSLCVKCSA